tara:strand:- start:23499 stop:24734 length:1236 start_codon:yes stop_codon:yes gene_type:complete
MNQNERTVWDLVESVTILFMRGYLAARARAFEHPMPMVRLLAQRDHAHSDTVLLERELAIYRSQRHRNPAKQRPHYAPQERAEILQLMRLRGWSCKETATRFVVHQNTIRNWRKALQDKHKSESVVGAPPWNKLHGGVRWLVHEMRQLCPERDFGTRTIARHIMRSGIQISRASVRRILEEERTPNPDSHAPTLRTRRTIPTNLVRPQKPHYVWHMDITSLRVLWLKLEVAAIIDGCTRKIVGIRAFAKRPTTKDLIQLIDDSIKAHSIPRFIISDRGSQFQRAFHVAMIRRGITHARGPVRVWQFNAKVERLFWSLKRWWRVSLMPPNLSMIQKRLDYFAAWHNLYRPHASLGMMTPSEVELGIRRPEPIRYTEGGELTPEISIKRHHVGHDPRLLHPVIKVKPKHRSVA